MVQKYNQYLLKYNHNISFTIVTYGVVNLPVAVSSMLNTCTVNSINEMLLRISTGCTDPWVSLMLYADWLNFTLITKYNKENTSVTIIKNKLYAYNIMWDGRINGCKYIAYVHMTQDVTLWLVVMNKNK